MIREFGAAMEQIIRAYAEASGDRNHRHSLAQWFVAIPIKLDGMAGRTCWAYEMPRRSSVGIDRVGRMVCLKYRCACGPYPARMGNVAITP